MSHEIRDVITFDGSGAYVKIGFRWYRLEELSWDERKEAESIVARREAAALKALGLEGKR